MSSESPPNSTESPDKPRSDRVVVQLVSSALLLLFVGTSLGSTVYGIAHFAQLPAFLEKNTLSPVERSHLLLFTAVGGVLPCLLAAGYLAFCRSVVAVNRVERVSRILLPLLPSFTLPLLFNWKAFAHQELLFSLSATLFGLAFERLLRISIPHWPTLTKPRLKWHLPPKLVKHLPLGCAIALAIFFGGYFSYFTVLNHYRLQTSSWDLAIFDNMFWNLLRGEWFHATPDLGRTGESHIQYHATFIAYLLLPFYALRQQADTLLIIQGVVVGATCIPLYLLAQRRSQNAWWGLLLALAFGLHAPQHGPVFYDFHFLTLAPFFICWVLYFYETERLGWLIGAWCLALSLREDQSACMAAAALFYLLSGKKPWWALIGGVLSATYFVVMKFGVMPLHRGGADKQTFSWMFAGLIPQGTPGFGGVIKTLLSNPLFVFNSLLEPEKLSYVLRMFGPVLLLPLRFAKNWILFVPAAIFTLLSSGYKPLYQTYFQYTSNWTPYLFFATAVSLARLKQLPIGEIRAKAAALSMALTVVIFSSNHGAVIGRGNFRGGFRKVQFERSPQDKKNYHDLKVLIDMIPPDASVAATETEAPHVSNRKECFTMRFGYYDADYLLVAIPEVSRGSARAHFKKAINTKQYGFVKRSGHFMLWQKGAPHDRNAQGIRLIGRDPSKRGRRH